MIHILVNMDDLTEIESALGMAKDKSTMVLRTAINNTAKEAEKAISRTAKSRYAYKKGVSDFRSANKIKKATTKDLAAIITMKGKTNEMLDFRVSPDTYYPGSKGAPSWIKGKIMRQGRLKKVALNPGGRDRYKAFVVKYQSGHLAFAQRVPGSHMRSNSSKEAIKSLSAMAVPKMEEIAYTEVLPDNYIENLLMTNIQAQIARYLG